MLSRTAENLYWLARYVERAEYIARTIDATLRVTALPAAYVGKTNEWESALLTAGVSQNFYKVHKEANEQKVKTMDLSGFKIIAFATHGLVPGELNGLTQPALALSAPDVSGTPGDGLLTMEEILGLKLDADWVILSACNTAGSSGETAEALSGMARAFFYAGTRALLVSHWEVGSDAAVKLTTGAFAELQRHPRAGTRTHTPL